MKWIVLGSSSGRPTTRRNVSAGALVREGEWLLFDCGEGTQHQLLRTDLKLSRLRYIFITHMHGDHVLGLPGLLGTMNLSRHDRPVGIFGPPGIARYIREVSKATHFRPIYHLDVVEVDEGTVLTTSDFTVEALRLNHRVLAFGYAVQEADRPGRFRLEDAKALGIPPGPLYGKLQRGEAVTLDDGRRIDPAEVVDPPRPGLRCAYCTDTGPSENVRRLARDAHLVIHEATYTRDMSDEAEERGHSTAEVAATAARAAGAHNLLITHFSPRFDDPAPLAAEARSIFADTIVARDLLEIDIAGLMKEKAARAAVPES